MMNQPLHRLVSPYAMIDQVNWSSLLDANGPAADMGIKLKLFLGSKSPEECEKHYWRIENFAFVQGEVFEVATKIIPILFAKLSETNCSFYIRNGIIEIMYQILFGVSANFDGVKRDFVKECISEANFGYWLLWKDYFTYSDDQVLDILGLLADFQVGNFHSGQ